MSTTICPVLTDEAFFLECLDDTVPGLTDTLEAAKRGDFRMARQRLAAFVRETVEPRGYFDLPYTGAENVTVLPEETEADACERILRHTLVSCGVPCAYGEGQTVDWTANPTPNGYMEWPWQLNRHWDAKLLAHRYLVTGEPRYAEAAMELMDSWIRQAVFPGDVPGWQTVLWRTIECGLRMGESWPSIFLTLYRTPVFTDDRVTDWLKSVVEHGRRLSRNHMSGNWLVMEMNGLGQLSILFPFLKDASAWLRQACESLAEELDRQFYPDGFQYELTTNYHHVAVKNYQRLIEFARAMKVTLPVDLTARLERTVDVEARLMMPDGRTPDLNDGRMNPVRPLAEQRLRIFPEKDSLLRLTRGEECPFPGETSMAFPYAGHVVMRSGWDKDACWALLDGAPFGRGHQHEDKLSVLYYAGGKLLLCEGNNYAYDDSAMRRYVRGSESHNTVLVDGQGQNRRCRYQWADEDIHRKADIAWHFGKDWDTAEAAYDEGYGEEAAARVRHQRRVFLRKSGRPLLMVADRLISQDTHDYQQLWHLDSLTTELAADRVRFEELAAVFSLGTPTVVRGQEDPWQGFTATSQVQGCYRPVSCLTVTVTGDTLRLVTVLVPSGSGLPLKVIAPAEVTSEDITLIWADGTEEKLNETEIRHL